MKVIRDVETQIKLLLEDDFREKICILLLKALGAYAVEKFHGPNENGKDVYFAYKDLLKEYKHCCLFIKAGDIGKSGSNDIRKIKTAVEEALFSPFISPLENNSEVYICEFYFICNGKLNDFARRYLLNLFQSKNFPNFKIVDIDKITYLVKKIVTDYGLHIDKDYVFQVDSFNSFCSKVVSFKEQFESKIIGSNILNS